MTRWNEYGGCCRATAAQDDSAVFCPECAHPLFRCASPGCGGLVTPLGHCPACIDLRLSLEQGAVLTARLGEFLSVPFALRNSASAGSISIRSVLRDATNAPQERVPVNWERLHAGQTRAFRVDAGPFERAGLGNLGITIVAAAAGEIEEAYAFSGDIAIDVEGPDPDRDVTINLEGASLGTGTMVVANSRPDGARRRAARLEVRAEVPLERAERYEIERGYRGYDGSGVRVPRTVEFVYAGFPAADAPRDGPLLQRALIRCGRNGRARDGRQDAQPNDLCLRIYDAGTAALDRDASGCISRRACDFLLANDRLYLRSLCEAGVAVNGERLAAGETRVVGDGDAFALPAGPGRRVAFGAAFKVSGGLVTQVRLEKTS